MQTRHSGPRQALLPGPLLGIQTLLVVSEAEASSDLRSLLDPSILTPSIPASPLHSTRPASVVLPTQRKRPSKFSQRDQLEGILGLATFIAEGECGIETYEPLSEPSMEQYQPQKHRKKPHSRPTSGKRKGKTLVHRKSEIAATHKIVCVRESRPAPEQEKLRRSTIHVAIAYFIKGDMQEKRPAID